MRFMLLVFPEGYEKSGPDHAPTPEAVEKMMKFNAEMQEAGVLLSLDGLHPPAAGTRVSFTGGKVAVAGGPFPETREAVGGYWIIKVNSPEEAVAWAKRAPMHHDAVIEVRQVFEMEEFPEDVQKAAGDFPERMKAGQG